MLMICYDMFSTNDIYLVNTGRLTLTGSTCGHFNTVVKNLISAVTKRYVYLGRSGSVLFQCRYKNI